MSGRVTEKETQIANLLLENMGVSDRTAMSCYIDMYGTFMEAVKNRAMQTAAAFPAHPMTATAVAAGTESNAPDRIGFWWYSPIHSVQWEMVEARDVGSGNICLYSCSRSWGGNSLESAKTRLPGRWVYVAQPS